ncbi:hypothetical protein [Acinetobacter sp. YH12086]|uniref:hypothetical protein n=1 Tax=Acinetobacter sp. YH12086 TaxID=2601078 RepID=UPI0015D0EA9D|nr:hypothetical protein [Acinetobacter sp. YH12086]
MKSNEEHSNFYIISCLILILVVLVVFYAKDYFLIEKARKYKIENKVKVGCLFLEKRYQTKHGIDKFQINIDGDQYLLSDVVVKDFPFSKKYYNFKKEISNNKSCYRISYVKVHILFFKRSFIYDLEY